MTKKYHLIYALDIPKALNFPPIILKRFFSKPAHLKLTQKLSTLSVFQTYLLSSYSKFVAVQPSPQLNKISSKIFKDHVYEKFSINEVELNKSNLIQLEKSFKKLFPRFPRNCYIALSRKTQDSNIISIGKTLQCVFVEDSNNIINHWISSLNSQIKPYAYTPESLQKNTIIIKIWYEIHNKTT